MDQLAKNKKKHEKPMHQLFFFFCESAAYNFVATPSASTIEQIMCNIFDRLQPSIHETSPFAKIFSKMHKTSNLGFYTWWATNKPIQ
jgi:hypothetical protein